MTQEQIKALAEKEYPQVDQFDIESHLSVSEVSEKQIEAFIKGAMLAVEENKLVALINECLKKAKDNTDSWKFVLDLGDWFTRAEAAIQSLELKPPASESRDAQPAKPDEGSGLVWVRASEDFKVTGFHLQREFVKYKGENLIIIFLTTEKPEWCWWSGPGKGSHLKVKNKEWNDIKILSEKISAPTDNGKEAKEPVVVLNRSQVEEIWDAASNCNDEIYRSAYEGDPYNELIPDKQTTIDNLFNKQQ